MTTSLRRQSRSPRLWERRQVENWAKRTLPLPEGRPTARDDESGQHAQPVAGDVMPDPSTMDIAPDPAAGSAGATTKF